MNRLRLILILLLPFALSLAGQTRIKLWGEHPKSFSMRQTNITVYRAHDSISNGMAVIVCPGGSYCYLGMKTEGKEVAHWLADNGITAIVLHYRVGILLNHHPAMIQDLQRALLWAKCNAADYGFRKDRIGVMGFSAGGHLAGMASIFFQHNYLDTLGIKAVRSAITARFRGTDLSCSVDGGQHCK
jgi:acetyl esterase/lipase